MSEILGALQDAASVNPEQAQQLVTGLAEKYNALSPEEHQEAIATLQELCDKAQTLPDDKKAEIANMIREYVGV